MDTPTSSASTVASSRRSPSAPEVSSTGPLRTKSPSSFKPPPRLFRPRAWASARLRPPRCPEESSACPMGIHTGQPLAGRGEYLGLDVHRTARSALLATVGKCSCRRRRMRRSEMRLPPASLSGSRHTRTQRLAEPEPLFQLLIAGAHTNFPALRIGAQSPPARDLHRRPQELARSLPAALTRLRMRRTQSARARRSLADRAFDLAPYPARGGNLGQSRARSAEAANTGAEPARVCRGRQVAASDGDGSSSALSATDTYVAMRSLLIGLALGVWFAVPWIASAVWISCRMGWRVGEPFPTQATSLRSFNLR